MQIAAILDAELGRRTVLGVGPTSWGFRTALGVETVLAFDTGFLACVATGIDDVQLLTDLDHCETFHAHGR